MAAPAALKNAALSATKAGGKKLGPLGPALLAADLAKNPWHVAKNRADKTGVVLADLLARTDQGSYVLVGHSLGARVMVVAAQTLGTKADGPRVEAAHLTGAAIGAKSDWDTLTARVNDAVYNYYSSNDTVLKYLYSVAMGGQRAAGLIGFTPIPRKLTNIDVSAAVERHSDYYTKIQLR
jgi:pimeloyl-ACP methyl ester carboxylesterase